MATNADLKLQIATVKAWLTLIENGLVEEAKKEMREAIEEFRKK